MPNRIIHIDAIKAVLMFLVTWGHVIQYTNIRENLDNDIAAFIYSFHMPMFMMLSGLFYRKQLKYNFSQMLRKNTFRLLIPATIITLFLFLMIYIHKPRGFEESISWLYYCRPWFVTTLFFCNVTTFLVYQFIHKIGYSFLFTFIIFCLIPDISSRLLFMYPFFVLGYYINSSYLEKYLSNAQWGG